MSEQAYQLSTEAAEFYESTFVPALFADWAARLVDAALGERGGSVLDVACGTGVVARTAADRPAVTTVTDVDRNEAMLAVARRIRPDLDWRQADAAELPFPNGSFDTVLCQAALMFFPDRVAALRDMARVAGPTGTVGLHVPGRLDHSPGYLALAEVAARHAGPDVIGLLGSYFAAGDPEQLTGTVRDAGLTIERMTTWTGATRLPSLTTFLDVELLPLADRIDQDTRARIDADCRTALTPFTDSTGAVAAPIEVHLLIAHPNAERIAEGRHTG